MKKTNKNKNMEAFLLGVFAGELLISKGADVNARNAAGDTALSIAAKNSWTGNSDKIIDLLKSAGATK